VLAGLLTTVVFALGAEAPDVAPSAAEWRQWRGPLGSGEGPHADPPVFWSEERNIRWKTAIPGRGHSTPVVSGNRLFLTTAVPQGRAVASHAAHSDGAHHNLSSTRRQQYRVLAIDRTDGSVLWSTTVRTVQPHESTHLSGSWASASPVTDGKHIYASFGSAGLYALDVEGQLLWQRDLGNMHIKHGHGEGSSPALHGNTLVVNWDDEAESFLIALDKSNGKTLWKVERDEVTSWSSPVIVVHRGKPQVIVAATGRVRGYDLANGEVIWECGGLSGNVVATPVAARGVVYVASSYETRAMFAIDLDAARGDISDGAAVLWRRDRDTPYVPSPLLMDDALCFLKHYQGVLTCVDAASGKSLHGPARLQGIRNVYASLAGAAGRLYVVDLDGTTAVLAPGEEFKTLSVNRLDDGVAASPVLVDEVLFLRGEHFLYAIAKEIVTP